MTGDLGDDGERRPLPLPLKAARSEPPPHVRSAWRSWLTAFATDPDVATAATLAYGALAPADRDAWLDALAMEAADLGVPPFALYAPLLTVEADAERIAKIEAALLRSDSSDPPQAQAMRGVAESGEHACVLVVPIRGDFVQTLTCRYRPDAGFTCVEHDSLCRVAEVPAFVDVGGIKVEPAPMWLVVEDLAHAILAQARHGEQTPDALASFAHLFRMDLR